MSPLRSVLGTVGVFASIAAGDDSVSPPSDGSVSPPYSPQ